MPGVTDVPVLLVVAVPAHSDWLAVLNGSTAAVVTGDLGLVHLAVLPRADFLPEYHMIVT